MVFYCCSTIYFKILKAKIRHRKYQSGKPDFIIRQMVLPPFRCVSFSHADIGSSKRIQKLKVILYQKSIFGFKKIVDVNVALFICTTYLHFECRRSKFYIEFLNKEFYVLGLPWQFLILFD